MPSAPAPPTKWLAAQLSCLHHALVQPGDRIKRREDRAFLPCRQRGGVLAGEHDAAVDLAEILVVLRAPLLRPVAAATERKRHPMPCDRNAVLEFVLVLRMDRSAELDCAPDPLLRRHRGELV